VAAGTTTITATSEGKSGTAAITVTAPPPPGTSVVLVGAGDIGNCSSSETGTAALLDGIAGTVFTAGDNAYPSGYLSDYMSCYDPYWGRQKARTKPAPGNHEYNDDQTSSAPGYYDYFGPVVGDSAHYWYSYDLGAWHVVVINSWLDMSVGSPQETWLKADLAASTKRCTMAYDHYPLFSSGAVHGSYSSLQPIWQDLYAHGAEIFVSGHDHEYERFAPQTPAGQLDTLRGIRQFVVGTGGAGLYTFGTPLPNSEVRDNSTWGVLKLTLSDSTYTWQFVPIAGQSFTDSGSGTCH
jgi:acid phosphatase type 7